MSVEFFHSYLSLLRGGEDLGLLSDSQSGLWHQVNDALAHLAEVAFFHTRLEVAANDGKKISVESRAVLPFFKRGLLFSGFEGEMMGRACLLIEPVVAGKWQLRIIDGEQSEFILGAGGLRGSTQQELAYLRRVLVPILQQNNREYIVI